MCLKKAMIREGVWLLCYIGMMLFAASEVYRQQFMAGRASMERDYLLEATIVAYGLPVFVCFRLIIWITQMVKHRGKSASVTWIMTALQVIAGILAFIGLIATSMFAGRMIMR